MIAVCTDVGLLLESDRAVVVPEPVVHLLGLTRSGEGEPGVRGEPPHEREDGGADLRLRIAIDRDVEVVPDETVLLRDREELPRDDVPGLVADVHDALVGVDRVQHRRRRVAAILEREAGRKRDPHPEDLEWIFLERDHEALSVDDEGLGARRQPGGDVERCPGDPRAARRGAKLRIAAVGRVAEEMPEEVAVVVDDEPEAYRVAPGRRERRHRDAPDLAEDLAERAIELAPVREGKDALDAIGDAPPRAALRRAGERALLAAQRIETTLLRERRAREGLEVGALATRAGRVLEVLADRARQVGLPREHLEMDAAVEELVVAEPSRELGKRRPTDAARAAPEPREDVLRLPRQLLEERERGVEDGDRVRLRRRHLRVGLLEQAHREDGEIFAARGEVREELGRERERDSLRAVVGLQARGPRRVGTGRAKVRHPGELAPELLRDDLPHEIEREALRDPAADPGAMKLREKAVDLERPREVEPRVSEREELAKIHLVWLDPRDVVATERKDEDERREERERRLAHGGIAQDGKALRENLARRRDLRGVIDGRRRRADAAHELHRCVGPADDLAQHLEDATPARASRKIPRRVEALRERMRGPALERANDLGDTLASLAPALRAARTDPLRGTRGANRLRLAAKHAHEDDDVVEPVRGSRRVALLESRDRRAFSREPGLVDTVTAEHAAVLADEREDIRSIEHAEVTRGGCDERGTHGLRRRLEDDRGLERRAVEPAGLPEPPDEEPGAVRLQTPRADEEASLREVHRLTLHPCEPHHAPLQRGELCVVLPEAGARGLCRRARRVGRRISTGYGGAPHDRGTLSIPYG